LDLLSEDVVLVIVFSSGFAAFVEVIISRY
jgi:hypothetical protein